MEFNQKLQTLRKQKGLTQEELAAALFVSRTAVSKWESGRGYPNIDSLKAIAAFFSITIDELLFTNEALTIAEADRKEREQKLRRLVFGLLDISSAMLLFLPFFAQRTGGEILEVSLLGLTFLSPWLKISYLLFMLGMVLSGIMALFLPKAKESQLRFLSLFLNGSAMLLFVLSLQPYAAVFLFFYLAIKGFLLAKRA